jgi:hypothetical protein
MHWASPAMVLPASRAGSLWAVCMLANARDDGCSCGIFEEIADPARFIETFRAGSRLAHLNQHEPAINAGRVREHVRRSLVRVPLVSLAAAAQENLGAALERRTPWDSTHSAARPGRSAHSKSSRFVAVQHWPAGTGSATYRPSHFRRSRAGAPGSATSRRSDTGRSPLLAI